MAKRLYDDEMNEEPEHRGNFQRASEEVLKTRVIKKAVGRNKKNTTDDVGASKGPFSDLKGFANTTPAGKSPFSFLSGISNASSATKKCSFSTPIATDQKAEAEDEKSRSYAKKVKQLNQLIITQIDENPVRDLTPLFNYYMNYSNEMGEGEDILKNSASEGAEKVPLMATLFFGGAIKEFTFSSPIATVQKAEAEDEKSSSYATKVKQLNQLLITQIDENPFRDLTPLFNHYVNYLKEIDTGEDIMKKSASEGAEKVPLMTTPFFGGAKKEFTFSSPIATVQKAEAEDEKSSSYATKLKQLNQLLINQIDENPVRDLTPIFNYYLNYLEEMEKGEDILKNSASECAEKVPLMATPFFCGAKKEFTFSSPIATVQKAKAKDEKSSSYVTKLKLLNQLLITQIDENPVRDLTPHLNYYMNCLKEMGEGEDILKDSASEGADKVSLMATSFFGDAKKEFTFSSPIATVQKSKAKDEKSSSYVTKLKLLNQSLINQIDEYPFRDLTPIFNYYLNYLEEMEKGEDILKNSASECAEKVPLMATPFFGGAKKEFTFSSPIRTAQKAQTEDEKSSSYATEVKQLNQLLITQIDENPFRDLTPLFNPDVNYLKEIDTGEDILKKSASEGAGSTSINDGAAGTTSSETYADKPASCNTSNSSAAATTSFPKFIVGSFGTSALLSAVQAKHLEGAPTSSAKTNAFSFGLKHFDTNRIINPFSSRTESCFFGGKVEEKSNATPPTFSGHIPSSDNNKEIEEKSSAFSFTPNSAFTNTKPPAQSVIPEESGDKSSPFSTSTSLRKFAPGSFGTSALISANKARFLGCASKSTEKETKATIYPTFGKAKSFFFGSNVDENSRYNHILFGGNIPSTANNKRIEEKPSDLSFAPGLAPLSLMDIKSPELTVGPEKSDKDVKQFKQNNAVYSIMCKIYFKTDGNYEDHGIGILHLMPIESSGKTQLLVRADTDEENILVNFILNKEILMKRVGMNNVLVVALSSPTSPIVLRLKTSEEAEELVATLQKYKK